MNDHDCVSCADFTDDQAGMLAILREERDRCDRARDDALAVFLLQYAAREQAKRAQ